MGYYVVFLVFLILSAAIYFGQGEDAGAEGALFSNPLKPSYVYFLTYGVTFLLLTVFSRWLPRPGAGMILSMALLGGLCLAWAPFVSDQPVVQRTLVLRLNVIVMASCFQIILSMVNDFRPILTAVRLVVWGTTLLNVLVVLAPHLFTVRMGAMQGRAAGLYGNPNLAATFMAMMLPLVTYGKPVPVRLLNYLVILVGIFFTFSRGGTMVWALAVLLDLICRPGETKIRPPSIVANIVLAGVFALLVAIFLTVIWGDLLDALLPHLNRDTFARLNGTDQGSGNERLRVLTMGFEAFKAHPVFGGGYAATRIWSYGVSVHNMFILMLAEFGLIGLLWYADFLRRIFRFPGRFGLVLGPLMTIESLFTHSYFDLAHYMLLVMLYWRLSGLVAEEPPDPAAKEDPHPRPQTS